LFHRNEVEPSGSSTSNRGQDESPSAVSQQSFSAAAAAGPSFPANKTPRGAKFSIAASRQASQQLQLQQEDRQEDEQGTEAAGLEDDAAFAARHTQPSRKPARLQVDTAVDDSDELPMHVAVSALSASAATAMRKPGARQQPERTSAAAKPWKKQEQQQQPQQQQHVSPSGFGLRQAGVQQGGVEELQKQLMLEAKAREVSGMRRVTSVNSWTACMSCQPPVGLVHLPSSAADAFQKCLLSQPTQVCLHQIAAGGSWRGNVSPAALSATLV
jgi:hypothetical protein